MNEADLGEYALELDMGKLYETYFASKRLLASVGFEHPALNGVARISTALIGQFDLNKRETDGIDENKDGVIRDSAFHTQYFSAKVSIPIKGRFVLEGGGALELAQQGENVLFAGAAEAGFSWLLPVAMWNQFSLVGRFSSGNASNSSANGVFTPVSAVAQGNIFQGKLSGLSLAKAEYTTWLHRTFSVDLSGAFFFKHTKTPYAGGNSMTGDGYFLGTELYALFNWSPVSDFMLNLGAGAFIPQSESDPMWKVNLAITFAVF
jgi:hypothetical protein